MPGLDYNSFFGLSKCYSLGNDFNGIDIKFALKNIFNKQNGYLGPFLLGIIVSIYQKGLYAIKKGISEKRFIPTKILVPTKGKKIKKIKSCNNCNIKRWYKLGQLFVVVS